MCSRPQTMFSKEAGREVTFACRTCDQCVAVRRHNWVARAMAEKAMHPQTLVVALTYSDETQFTRDGARFFRYNDVRLFLAALRDAIKQKTGKVAALRFIACGEQGSRNGRVHWHIVLFSDVDLLTIGKFSALWGPVTERKDIIAPVGVDMPRQWSMWPHGFVQVQEPNEGGMHYAMSYALKDQFNVRNASGSARISKAEAFATGLFRPSKSPPIGAPWVDEQIYDMYARRYVMPKLHFQVPGLSGYWWPSGPLRKRLLEGMRRVNNSIIAETGRNAAQWSSLLHQVRENEGDLEALGINEVIEDDEEIETQIAKRSRATAQESKDRQIRRQCGHTIACDQCLRGFADETLREIGLHFEGPHCIVTSTGEAFQRGKGGYGKGINPRCQLRETASRKRAFIQSAR